MRNTLLLATLCIAAATTGCFVSHKETVREVPTEPTVEHRTTVQTLPPAAEVREHTTVERY